MVGAGTKEVGRGIRLAYAQCIGCSGQIFLMLSRQYGNLYFCHEGEGEGCEVFQMTTNQELLTDQSWQDCKWLL
jgi:hypothetical protein